MNPSLRQRFAEDLPMLGRSDTSIVKFSTTLLPQKHLSTRELSLYKSWPAKAMKLTKAPVEGSRTGTSGKVAGVAPVSKLRAITPARFRSRKHLEIQRYYSNNSIPPHIIAFKAPGKSNTQVENPHPFCPEARFFL
jgi:hypothetical protein